jgi:hypothetical protein
LEFNKSPFASKVMKSDFLSYDPWAGLRREDSRASYMRGVA